VSQKKKKLEEGKGEAIVGTQFLLITECEKEDSRRFSDRVAKEDQPQKHFNFPREASDSKGKERKPGKVEKVSPSCEATSNDEEKGKDLKKKRVKRSGERRLLGTWGVHGDAPTTEERVRYHNPKEGSRQGAMLISQDSRQRSREKDLTLLPEVLF